MLLSYAQPNHRHRKPAELLWRSFCWVPPSLAFIVLLVSHVVCPAGDSDSTTPVAVALTAERLVPSDAKALVRLNIGGVVRSDAGKANLQSMLESPSGQQAAQQLAGFQAKYGFNYLTDLQSATLIAPFTGGEPFSGVLLVAEGAFQRRRIELVLANVDKMPHEQHAEVTVYEQTGQGGGGRFFFAFLSDKVFVASMERQTVRAAIERAAEAPEGMPAVLAAATSHLPENSSISLVMDVSAFNKNGPEWQDFKKRTNWWSLSVDMGASKTITAMLEGKTPDDAQAMRDHVLKMFSPDGGGRQAFQVIPLPFQPDYGLLNVSQAGRVVVIKAKGLN